MKLATAVMSLALVAATSAFAGGRVVPVDPPLIPPAPPPAYNWTGGYAGLGLGFGNASATLTGIPPTTFPSARGVVGSALLGYNWQGAGAFVLGAEAMLSAGRIRGTATCPNPAFDCTARLDNMAAARLRMGVAQDRTLFFVTLGAATATQRFEGTNGVITDVTSARVNGWTAGIGIEQAMANGWNLRGDLEHYRFGSANHVITGNPFTARTRANVARISAVFRF